MSKTAGLCLICPCAVPPPPPPAWTLVPGVGVVEMTAEDVAVLMDDGAGGAGADEEGDDDDAAGGAAPTAFVLLAMPTWEKGKMGLFADG